MDLILFSLTIFSSIFAAAFYLKFKKTFKYLKDIENDNFLILSNFKDLEKNLELEDSQHKLSLESLKESFEHERRSMEEKKIEIRTREKDFEVSIAKLTEDLEKEMELKSKVTSQKKVARLGLVILQKH